MGQNMLAVILTVLGLLALLGMTATLLRWVLRGQPLDENNKPVIRRRGRHRAQR